jgi:hypothetical protein
MKKYLGLALLTCALNANAGWLAEGVTVYQVANSLSPQVNSPTNSTDRFALKVTGGTIDVCQGAWIVFEKSYFGNNPEAYTRAYTLAITAYATGSKVKVHNLNSDSCNGATSIQLYK